MERFGIEAFQIHIHKDEGYMNAKQWTPNLHAHVVFDWTQPNGKSVRLSRDDMAELQTIASETLGMERGVSSDQPYRDIFVSHFPADGRCYLQPSFHSND